MTTVRLLMQPSRQGLQKVEDGFTDPKGDEEVLEL